MDGLGDLGFWLMIGMIISAKIVSRQLKERDRERERQATIRALLEKDEKAVTEVLAYLRERDAADAVEAERERAGSGGNMREWGAIGLGVLAFGLGVFAYGKVRYGSWSDSESVLVLVAALLTMFGIWVGGIFLARRIWSSKKKHDAHPGA
jgi:uncharacterized protein YneF (UPF0154 family)